MTQRHILCLLFAGSVAAIAGAWIAQTFLGIHPCVLCMYQRHLYWALMLVAALGALVAYHRIPTFALGVAILLLLAQMGVAFYQVAVEQHWVATPAICKAPAIASESVADLKQQLMAQPHVSCDQVQWELFGISMAGYNSLYAFALLLLAAIGLCRTEKKS